MPINNISVLIMEKSANHFVARDVYFFTEYPSVKNFLFYRKFRLCITKTLGKAHTPMVAHIQSSA